MSPLADSSQTMTWLSPSDLASPWSDLSAAEEFLERHVLNLSDGIETLGGIQWGLLISLLIAWIVVGGALIKGVKSSGKVRIEDGMSVLVSDSVVKVNLLWLNWNDQGPKPTQENSKRTLHIVINIFRKCSYAQNFASFPSPNELSLFHWESNSPPLRHKNSL